jgi:protein involved in polysaccharide export with SLBB domain
LLVIAAAGWLTVVHPNTPLLAQAAPANMPTPQQAEAMLRARPELAAQLRQRLQASGLSPVQVRARLRAAGYPDALLDQVMGTSTTAEGPRVSADSLIGALRSLGVVDSTDATVLRRMALANNAMPSRALASDSGNSRAVDARETDGRSAMVADYPRDGSTLFGLDLFSQPTTLFDANAGGPVDASYRLGPGDQLVLILTGDVEEAYTLDVTREGFVVVPVVGQIPVSSLTLGELDSVLRKRLARVYSGLGSSTRFSVSVARLRSNQVFVVGDVKQPGSYRISSAGTALTALYSAGGPSDRGSLRAIEIRRRGAPAQKFDIYNYLIRGDASGDVRLENGDVLFVPPHGARVRVRGGVLRPATYELRAGETLDDLVKTAGGFTDDASRRNVRIERIVPPSQRTAEGSDRIVLDVAVPDHSDAKTLGGVRLEGGDIVDVARVANRVRSRITVNGNVWQPGPQGITAGQTLAEALQRAGGVKPDTYLGRVIVSRLRPDSTREQVRATLRDLSGATVEPMVLKEDDEITVFSLTEFRAPRYVAVSGAVVRAGQYVYHEGMTLRDLVLQAGGLHPSAALRDVEIARLPRTRDEGIIATTFRAPLDSSFMVNGSSAPPTAAEVTLEPYDNVLIFRQPDWQLQQTVVLSGEVHYPGVYSLRSKTERLADVIERAGGLTNSAYAGGISFARADGGLGRVGIDLPSVLKNPKDRDNLLLIAGDSIHVPRFNALVTIAGAVNSPLAVPYEPGKSLGHYIRAAGGSTAEGDPDRVWVQQANGKVESRHSSLWFFTASPAPGPGSRVFVPSKDPNAKKDWAQLLGTTAQVLGSIVTIAVVLSRTN